MSTPPPVEPHLWVSDLPRSIGWYRTVGWEVSQTFPDADAPTWVQLSRGDARAMLAIAPLAGEGYVTEVPARLAGPGGATSIYLRVESADEVFEAATVAGLEIVEPIWNAWWGGRQFTLRDPDGHWWTVFAPSGA